MRCTASTPQPSVAESQLRERLLTFPLHIFRVGNRSLPDIPTLRVFGTDEVDSTRRART
jgi:hypothetical protein